MHIWSPCRHLKNGVYKKKNALDDDFSVISLNNKQVVFSFHTALYLLNVINLRVVRKILQKDC